jgi:hypothetical protein
MAEWPKAAVLKTASHGDSLKFREEAEGTQRLSTRGRGFGDPEGGRRRE